jgi:hypothetical protein
MGYDGVVNTTNKMYTYHYDNRALVGSSLHGTLKDDHVYRIPGDIFNLNVNHLWNRIAQIPFQFDHFCRGEGLQRRGLIPQSRNEWRDWSTAHKIGASRREEWEKRFGDFPKNLEQMESPRGGYRNKVCNSTWILPCDFYFILWKYVA